MTDAGAEQDGEMAEGMAPGPGAGMTGARAEVDGVLDLPRLETPRAVLRTPRPADVEALLAVFGDPRVTRYWSSPPMTDRSAAEALLAGIVDGRRSGRLHQWALARREDDRLIGTVTLAAIDPRNRRADLGYALARDHWGAGWMAEALPVVLDHAFGPLGLHRLEADVDPRNVPSIRRLEALGFREEGRLRERWHVQGEVQDSALFGLLAREWTRGGQVRAAGGSPSG